MDGALLSTTDSGPSSSCTSSDAVPWFYGSCCSTCPSYFGGYWSDEAHPMVSYTGSTADLHGRYEWDVCSAEVQIDAYGSSFRGVDSMSVFLR